MQWLPRLSLVFWGVSVFCYLKTLCYIVIILVTIETSDMILLFLDYGKYKRKELQRTWGFVLKMLSRKCKRLVSRILGWYLELGHVGISRMITSWQCWSHPTLFYLGLKQRLTSFLKEIIKIRLFWSFVNIKLDRLKMFEVRCLIVNFHLLVLGVLSNAILDSIYGSPWVT